MSLLQMSASGGIVILVIIIARALFMHRLPKRAFVWLWVLALARLMLPFSIPFRLSVYTAASRIPIGVTASTAAPVRQLAQATASVARWVQASPAAPGIATMGQPAAPIGAPVNAPLPFNWPLAVYLTGAMLVTLYLLAAYFMLRREFRRATPLTSGFAYDWVQAQRLRRPVRVFVSGGIKSPITYGFMRPCVLLPESLSVDETQLRYVLTHEFTHIRQLDAPMKLLFACCLCAHWFNPLVWVMYVLYNRDVELSCDEKVVSLFGIDSRQSYARLLLDMQEGRNRLAPLCNGFSRYSLRERIVAIMKHKKTSAFAVILAILMTVGIAGAFATSAELPMPTVNPAWRNTTWEEDDPDSEYDEPEPDARVLALMALDYENMSVKDFEDAVRRVFPELNGSSWNVISNQGFYGDIFGEAYARFVSGPLTRAVDGMGIIQHEIWESKYPYDPDGYQLRMVNPELDPEYGFGDMYVEAEGWLGYQALDPNAITVGEREHILSEYEQQIKALFASLDPDTLLQIDPITLLNQERDRLTAQLSTPALRVRLINIRCTLYKDGVTYNTPLTFIDSVEVPPVQTPLSDENITLLHTDALIGISYGRLNGEGVISPDNGVTWYANGYRDPVTGLRHQYNPGTDMREVSPDDGRHWFVETGTRTFTSVELECSLLFGGYGHHYEWAIGDVFYYTPYEEMIPTTLTESLTWGDQETDSDTMSVADSLDPAETLDAYSREAWKMDYEQLSLYYETWLGRVFLCEGVVVEVMMNDEEQTIVMDVNQSGEGDPQYVMLVNYSSVGTPEIGERYQAWADVIGNQLYKDKYCPKLACRFLFMQ